MKAKLFRIMLASPPFCQATEDGDPSTSPRENSMRKNLVPALPTSRRPFRVHEKSAFLPMHSVEALPQAYCGYTERQCAQLGASSLTCRPQLKK